MKLSDIDLYNLDTYEKTGIPHEQLAFLRQNDPVHWHPREAPNGPGFWALTKYDDVVFASKNPQIFSSSLGGTNIQDYPEENMANIRMMMVNMDPPQHAKFRAIVSKGFTPRMVERMESAIRTSVNRLIDHVSETQECDFVRDIAAQLPLKMICELLGVPDVDRPKIYHWTNKLIGFDDPEYQTGLEDAMEAATEVWSYAHNMATERRESAANHNDLVSTLVHAKVGDESLTDMEISSFFLLLIIAGNETVRNAVTRGMLTLLEHPEQKRDLAQNLHLMDSAIEEILRWVTPVIHFRRTMLQDLELRGKHLKKGDKVVMYYPSVNRDEDIFPDSQRFDIRRTPNNHLSFGIGQHFCMGANLARLEMKITFEAIMQRLPNLELAGSPRWLRSNFINGVKSMPVRYKAVASADDSTNRKVAV